jgi:hypothetical protein
MENLACFCVHPSVEVEYFWMDLNGRHVFASTPIVGVVHMGGVYMILILRA